MDDKELKPGPELDAAVAERVMGQERPNCTYSGQGGGGLSHGADGRMIYEDWWVCAYCNGTIRNNEVPLCPTWPYTHFSEDIAAAWQVVERLIADGWTFELGHATGRDYHPWIAWLYHGEEDKLGRWGESAPHAISLAAVAAMEANEKEINQ